ncbi:hypothetical protein EJB05_25697, partial [Eragrostis curvula]
MNRTRDDDAPDTGDSYLHGDEEEDDDQGRLVPCDDGWRRALSVVRAILQRNRATRGLSSSTTPAPRWVRVPDLLAAVRDVPGARRPPDQPPQVPHDEAAAAIAKEPCGGGPCVRHQRRRRAKGMDDCADLDLKRIVTQHERPGSAASICTSSTCGRGDIYPPKKPKTCCLCSLKYMCE